MLFIWLFIVTASLKDIFSATITGTAKSGITCITHNGLQGICVPIHNCFQIWSQLNKFPSYRLSSSTIKRLKEERCNKEEQKGVTLICCPECGHIKVKRMSDRIINGGPAQLGTWPWIVALQRDNSGYDSTFTVLCGGSLISNRWVVTAAHCFRTNTPKIVRVGELNIKEDVKDGAHPEDVPIAPNGIIIHPNYTSAFSYDIALILLNRSVTFNDNVVPICLPVAEMFKRNEMYERKKFSVAGWGFDSFGGIPSDALLEVSVDFVLHSSCTKSYSNDTLVSITERHICAGTKGNDSCQGDSGGPLVYYGQMDGDNIKTYYLVGVVSYGNGCGQGFPGVYTNVAHYIDWIGSVIANRKL